MLSKPNSNVKPWQREFHNFRWHQNRWETHPCPPVTSERGGALADLFKCGRRRALAGHDCGPSGWALAACSNDAKPRSVRVMLSYQATEELVQSSSRRLRCSIRVGSRLPSGLEEHGEGGDQSRCLGGAFRTVLFCQGKFVQFYPVFA